MTVVLYSSLFWLRQWQWKRCRKPRRKWPEKDACSTTPHSFQGMGLFCTATAWHTDVLKQGFWVGSCRCLRTKQSHQANRKGWGSYKHHCIYCSEMGEVSCISTFLSGSVPALPFSHLSAIQFLCDSRELCLIEHNSWLKPSQFATRLCFNCHAFIGNLENHSLAS